VKKDWGREKPGRESVEKESKYQKGREQSGRVSWSSCEDGVKRLSCVALERGNQGGLERGSQGKTLTGKSKPKTSLLTEQEVKKRQSALRFSGNKMSGRP